MIIENDCSVFVSDIQIIHLEEIYSWKAIEFIKTYVLRRKSQILYLCFLDSLRNQCCVCTCSFLLSLEDYQRSTWSNAWLFKGNKSCTQRMDGSNICRCRILIYVAGLLCSHKAAFRVQTNLRKDMMHHIIKLPLGTLEALGSGKVRKTVNECSESTETYLAHQLPDMVTAYITPIGLLFMLFSLIGDSVFSA